MNHTECPVCGGRVDFEGELVADELLSCPDCMSELLVRGLSPLSLAEAPVEASDWGE